MLFPLLLLLAVLAFLPAYVEVAVAQPAGAYEFVTTWTWPDHAVFDGPQGVAVGPDGSVYVVDTGSNRVQKFTAQGGYVTAWGSPGSDPGEFDWPQDVAVGPDGSVYVVDSNNDRVQRFTAAGSFVTEWGTRGDGDGQFAGPLGIAVDQSGNVYVADWANDRIQKFTSAGVFVAAWGENGVADGKFQFPADVAVDQSGHVYVADSYNQRIQKFTTAGTFVTAWGDWGSGAGYFRFPTGVAVSGDGSVYVTDRGNNRVQKFTAAGGFVTTWGHEGYLENEFSFEFGQVGVAVSSGGTVYVTDTGNDEIKTFTSGGVFLDALPEHYGSRYPLTTYYDTHARWSHTVDRHGALWDEFSYNDTPLGGGRLEQDVYYPGGDYRDWAETRYFYWGVKLHHARHVAHGDFVQASGEEDIAVDGDGSVYVADSNKPGIQQFTAGGEFVTQWPPVWALAIATDGDGNVYVVDCYQQTEYEYSSPVSSAARYRVRKFDPDGNVETEWLITRSAAVGFYYLPGSAAIAVDHNGYVYLALSKTDRVYKLAPGGGDAVTSWGGTGSADGLFSGPYGMAVDDAGYVYVSDAGNHRIQKFTATGAFVTKWGVEGSANGELRSPGRLAVDGDGFVYAADTGNHRIQKFTATGAFVTKWGSQGNGEGEFVTPYSVAVGPDGAVYVVDTGNRRRVQKFAVSAGDTSAPVTSDDSDGLWHRTPVTVHLTATDNAGGSGMSGGLAKTEYSKDGGATWVTGDEVTYDVWKRGGGSGLHTLLYRSTDAAGNLEGTKSVDVKVDARAPVTANDAPLAPQAGGVTVHLTAADSLFGVSACSGVASVTYSLDGGAPQTVPGAAASVPVSGAGLHWIGYYATDNAGNAEYLKWCSVTVLAGASAKRSARASALSITTRR